MAEGLKRATLEAICSRGPWKGGTGTRTRFWMLTAEELRAFYAAVPHGPEAMSFTLGVLSLSERKADRALQLLRKAGLIRYDHSTRTWRYPGLG